MRLLRAVPRLALRDCGDCRQHVYDEATGRPALYRGLPVLRPPGTCPPCRLPHVGCLKGSPEHPQTLSPENLQAWLFDCQCRATGQWPDDPIVRRHAWLIALAENREQCAESAS